MQLLELIKNLLFSELYVHKQCSQCSCSCVETLVILRAKFHVVSSLFSVLKIVILMLAYECPRTGLKMSLPENETTVNLRSASFVIIMLLQKGLTDIHSQIKPSFLFGESFTLSTVRDTGVRMKGVFRIFHVVVRDRLKCRLYLFTVET